MSHEQFHPKPNQMVVLLVPHSSHPPLSLSAFSSSPTKRRKNSSVSRRCISSSPAMTMSKFMEFPHLSTPYRELMVDLVSTMENQLGTNLLPCSLPPDVDYFENETGSSQGTLYIRSGAQDSQVDFILGSWLHSKLPSGALNITTLTAYLNTTTDSPRFLLEIIQSTPTSLILILDLPPRKDLVLHADYLNTFYTETQLDTHRQHLQKLSEIQPYFSSSLYIRSALSPAAISVAVNCEVEGLERMEEILRNHIGPAAKKVLEIWLTKCACGGRRELGDTERVELQKRDHLVNKKTAELDLASGLPRLFGVNVAGRVIEAIQKVFKV